MKPIPLISTLLFSFITFFSYSQGEFLIEINPMTGSYNQIGCAINGIMWVYPYIRGYDETHGAYIFQGGASLVDHLYSIDVTNGSIISNPYFAPSGTSVREPKYDNTNNLLYGLYWDNSLSQFFLDTVNPVTGFYAKVNTTPIAGLTSTLQGGTAYDEINHRYFASDNIQLFSIDALSGNLISSPTLSFASGEQLLHFWYNNSTNVLYGLLQNSNTQICYLVSINTVSGVMTKIGTGSSFGIGGGSSSIDRTNQYYFHVYSTGGSTYYITTLDISTGNVIANKLIPLSSGSNIQSIAFDNVKGKLYGIQWDATISHITATVNGNNTVCSGDTVELDASGGGIVYSWSTGETGSAINVRPISTTTYTVTGTCGNTATVLVNVNFPPSVGIIGGSSVCSGQSTTLIASGGDTYSWNTGETTTAITVAPNTLTTYTVTATNSCGTATASIRITVNTLPTITTSPNPSICMGSSTTITASGANTYTWIPAIGLNSTTGTSVIANPAITTTYTVTGSDGTCNNSTTVVVTVNPNPIANAGADLTIFYGDSIMINASGGGTYSWNPTSGLSCDTCKNPVAKPIANTDYCVTVSDINNCTANDCMTITVKKPDIQCGEVFIPNAFSPDNNGENDMECVFGKCIQTMQFIIYDRWGEKVFESTDPKFCWNGIYNGKPMNTGVFVYSFNATLITGEKVSKKGNISLIR